MQFVWSKNQLKVCFHTILLAALKVWNWKYSLELSTLTLHNNQKFLIFQDLSKERNNKVCHKHNMQVLDVVKTLLHAFALFQELVKSLLKKRCWRVHPTRWPSSCNQPTIRSYFNCRFNTTFSLTLMVVDTLVNQELSVTVSLVPFFK